MNFNSALQGKNYSKKSEIFKNEIKMKDLYRVYNNFVILFVKDKVGDIKYSSYKNFVSPNLT